MNDRTQTFLRRALAVLAVVLFAVSAAGYAFLAAFQTRCGRCTRAFLRLKQRADPFVAKRSRINPARQSFVSAVFGDRRVVFAKPH